MDKQSQANSAHESDNSGLMAKLHAVGSCHQTLPGKVWSKSTRAEHLSQEIATAPPNSDTLKMLDDYYVSVAAAHRYEPESNRAA